MARPLNPNYRALPGLGKHKKPLAVEGKNTGYKGKHMKDVSKAAPLLRPKKVTSTMRGNLTTTSKGPSAFLKPKVTTTGYGQKMTNGGGLTTGGKIAAGGVGTGTTGVLAGIRQNRKKRQMGNIQKAYEFSSKATKKDKKRYVAEAVAGTAAAGTGGYLHGSAAGDKLMQGKSLGRSLVTAAGTKKGAAGLTVAGTGIAANANLDRRYKNKGKLVKKNDSTSAFGVDHG